MKLRKKLILVLEVGVLGEEDFDAICCDVVDWRPSIYLLGRGGEACLPCGVWRLLLSLRAGKCNVEKRTGYDRGQDFRMNLTRSAQQLVIVFFSVKEKKIFGCGKYYKIKIERMTDLLR